MAEAKTVQQQVRPVTIRCASEGCTAKADGAATFTGDGDNYQVIAPRGWTFGAKHPKSTSDVAFGSCPAHSAKKK